MPNDLLNVDRPKELTAYLKQFLPASNSALSPCSSANNSRPISPQQLERPRMNSFSELGSPLPSSSSSSGDATPSGQRTPKDLILGQLKFPEDETEYTFKAKDLKPSNLSLEDSEIGRGNFGHVYRMVHCESARVMAVKRIRATSIEEKEQKRLLIELDTAMHAQNCHHIIRFYGALLEEGDCWICMELMDISLERLYKKAFELDTPLTEAFVGHITVCTIIALSFLKDHLKIMHRDVKPSNIVMNRDGAVKLVDFGIAGQLVNSAASSEGGCSPYLAPERLTGMKSKYDVRSDVWSLGITLVEISTGRFPYSNCESVFQQMQEVVDGPSPLLTCDQLPPDYKRSFCRFVNCCLAKDRKSRPKYHELMARSFYKRYQFVMDDQDTLRTFGYFVEFIIENSEGYAQGPFADFSSNSF